MRGAIAAALIALMILGGCGGQDAAPAAPAAPGAAPGTPAKPRIALIMKSLANEFFLTMEQGAKNHQAAHSGEYDLICNGIKDELDVNRQIQLVENMVSQGVQAIIIAPADSKALVAACQKAQEAGVVVVNIDNKLDDTVLAERRIRIPFVGPDNRKGAKVAADFLATKLQPGDPVAIVEGVPTAFNGIQRKLGFEDAMNGAGMKIVTSQSGSWEMAKANQVVAAMITEHPELKAVLCANDSMALGAVAALKSADRVGANKAGQVLVIGYDGISAVRERIKDGSILATIEQHADQLAVFGIEYALDMIKTKAAPADRETPVDLVMIENAGGTPAVQQGG